jgi:hypothetical protein
MNFQSKKNITILKNEAFTRFEKWGGIEHCEFDKSTPNMILYVMCKSIKGAMDVVKDLDGIVRDG